MPKRMATIVAALTLTLAMSAPALANTSRGRLKSFTYNLHTKTGTMTIINSRTGVSTYKLTPKTACGESFGQSGNAIPCNTLQKAKYDRKPMYVKWTRDAAGKRVASVASADMS